MRGVYGAAFAALFALWRKLHSLNKGLCANIVADKCTFVW